MDTIDVVLVDEDRWVPAAGRLLELVRGATAFATLPILLLPPDPAAREAAATVPGVLGVAAVPGQVLSIAAGVDRALLLGTGLDDDLRIGGVGPGEDYPYVFGEPQGTAAPPALCAAINISLGPKDEGLAATDPLDLVNHVTRLAARSTVPVVAAGNGHRAGVEYETVSPWAEPEWVLSVGATSDHDGLTEAPSSGRAGPGQPGVGPDVLCWGQSLITDDPDVFGTSFAAGCVSRFVAEVQAWLLHVVAGADRLLGNGFGVPLLGVFYVDEGFSPAPRAVGWPALPVVGAADGAFAGLTPDELRALRDAVAAQRPALSRRLLLAAAAATTPAGALSAPSITRPRLHGWLAGLTAPGLAGHCGLPPAGGDTPLFPAGSTEKLGMLWQTAFVTWGWDIGARRAAVLTGPPEE